MKEFNSLIEIADRLLSPSGCPWDREQTLLTLQPYLLEEAHELIEAIDSGEGAKMAEELGDVFYALIFIAKLAEKEKIFSLADALDEVSKKLIRRHPHVFGETKVSSTDDIVKNWDQIKKEEQKQRKPAGDGIPPTLPMLARAQKLIRRQRRAKGETANLGTSTKEKIGEKLWEIVAEAEASGVDAESALRVYLRSTSGNE